MKADTEMAQVLEVEALKLCKCVKWSKGKGGFYVRTDGEFEQRDENMNKNLRKLEKSNSIN